MKKNVSKKLEWKLKYYKWIKNKRMKQRRNETNEQEHKNYGENEFPKNMHVKNKDGGKKKC